MIFFRTTKLLLTTVILLLLFSCDTSKPLAVKKKAEEKVAEIVPVITEVTPSSSGLYLDYMDTSISPGDNFQMFVNGKWIDETEIPSDKSSFGVGMILHEQSQDHVKEIIEWAAESKHEEGADEQKVGVLYASFMDMETRNKLGAMPLKWGNL